MLPKFIPNRDREYEPDDGIVMFAVIYLSSGAAYEVENVADPQGTPFVT